MSATSGRNKRPSVCMLQVALDVVRTVHCCCRSWPRGVACCMGNCLSARSKQCTHCLLGLRFPWPLEKVGHHVACIVAVDASFAIRSWSPVWATGTLHVASHVQVLDAMTTFHVRGRHQHGAERQVRPCPSRSPLHTPIEPEHGHFTSLQRCLPGPPPPQRQQRPLVRRPVE